MVDSGTSCEKDGSEIGYVYFLLSELSGSQAFDLDEGTEYYFNTVAARYIVVRRFFRRWFWL